METKSIILTLSSFRAPQAKTAQQCKHAKSVTAIALLLDGKLAGKIVADYSDNPNGSVCTATVNIWHGILANHHGTGRAGGYGYDKLSAAVYYALVNSGVNVDGVLCGDGRTQEVFEAAGYVYAPIL